MRTASGDILVPEGVQCSYRDTQVHYSEIVECPDDENPTKFKEEVDVYMGNRLSEMKEDAVIDIDYSSYLRNNSGELELNISMDFTDEDNAKSAGVAGITAELLAVVVDQNPEGALHMVSNIFGSMGMEVMFTSDVIDFDELEE